MNIFLNFSAILLTIITINILLCGCITSLYNFQRQTKQYLPNYLYNEKLL